MILNDKYRVNYDSLRNNVIRLHYVVNGLSTNFDELFYNTYTREIIKEKVSDFIDEILSYLDDMYFEVDEKKIYNDFYKHLIEISLKFLEVTDCHVDKTYENIVYLCDMLVNGFVGIWIDNQENNPEYNTEKYIDYFSLLRKELKEIDEYIKINKSIPLVGNTTQDIAYLLKCYCVNHNMSLATNETYKSKAEKIINDTYDKLASLADEYKSQQNSIIVNMSYFE